MPQPLLVLGSAPLPPERAHIQQTRVHAHTRIRVFNDHWSLCRSMFSTCMLMLTQACMYTMTAADSAQSGTVSGHGTSGLGLDGAGQILQHCQLCAWLGHSPCAHSCHQQVCFAQLPQHKQQVKKKIHTHANPSTDCNIGSWQSELLAVELSNRGCMRGALGRWCRANKSDKSADAWCTVL